jgi:predicted ATPase/DNA-binding CsgD family transcriptional regulator
MTAWGVTHDDLPSARSELFGRDEEVGRVRRLLADGTRLVTITGAGGVGKTRVAVAAARQLPGRVSFVDLSGTAGTGTCGTGTSGTGAAGLLGALARALVPQPDAARDPERSIAQALAGEPRVVVLDTFEHLLAAAPVLDDLLEACPELRLLVTSRTRLRIAGEQVVPVGPLPTGVGQAAVAMFRQRARAVGGLGPSAGPEDEAALAALCERLGGSPLAIELAAARTVMFTPAALAAALAPGQQSRLRMLAGGAPAGRHRDMRSTIAWSYLLLDDGTRRLLRWLAVFPGSFDLEAAAAVAGGDPADVLDQLTGLVDWHLVEPAAGPADAPRFTLLDLLREFAAEQLGTAGELAAAQLSFLRWSTAFADRAAAGTESAAEAVWLDRTDRELPSLRAALNLLLSRQDAPRGVRLAGALGWFWAHRGPMAEGQRWLRQFLALDTAGQLSARTRATAVAWSARLAVEEGVLDLAPLAAARDRLAAEPDADADWLRATEHLAYGLTMRGDLDAADELTVAGLDRATRLELAWWRCVFLQRRALAAQRHGQRDRAVAYARETVQAAQAIGYERIVARAEQIIAHERARELGPEGSRAALHANLRAHQAAGDLRGVVSTMALLGAATAAVDAPAAARWLADGLATGARIGYWHGEAYCVVATIVLLITAGRPLDAARLDGALRPHQPALRASMPPGHYRAYRSAVESARSADPAAFDRAAETLAGGWPGTRTAAAAILATLTAEPTAPTTETPATEAPVAAPAPAPVRRRGPRANPDLTGRELEVLRAIAAGRTNPQIAADLHLSPKTVMHHSTSVYRKLGVRGRAEAVALAYRTGLLTSAAGS